MKLSLRLRLRITAALRALTDLALSGIRHLAGPWARQPEILSRCCTCGRAMPADDPTPDLPVCDGCLFTPSAERPS